MINPHYPSKSIIPRPSEYERLVDSLIDQSYYTPVAISTSLRHARGMGKTTLAREVCRDPRVTQAYPDGVLWVTVGEGLSPLQLLTRIERLIYDISGEQHGPTDLKSAQEQLRDLIHPRRILLVLDEAGDREAVQPFLQTGPGGRVLLITRDDRSLPLGTHSIPVDIMETGEAAALLACGLEKLEKKSAAPQGGEPPPPPPLPGSMNGALAGSEIPGAAAKEAAGVARPDEAQDADDLLEAKDESDLPASLLERIALQEAQAAPARMDARECLASAGIAGEAVALLVDLAGRLNEWPLLLAWVNGLLRGCFEPRSPMSCETLSDAVRATIDLLARNQLSNAWLVTDPIEQEGAVSAVVTACLEPLSPLQRESLLDLVVFPQDEEIPLAAASVLWRCSAEETYLTAESLARRALITLDPAAWTIHLHPLLAGFINDHLRIGVLGALHRRLVEGYALRCRENPNLAGPAGWATGPDDGYFFQHLGTHLAAAGQRADLQALLFNFRWFAAYLSCTNLLTGRRGDLYSLLLDFELAHSVALDRQSAELRLIEEALRTAAPLLAREPAQLSTQLMGRLLSFDEPEIQELLRQVENWTDQPWLRPLSACFAAPGGDEVRAISGHADWVTGLALLSDGQFAVSGSLDGTLRWWDLANGQNMRTIVAHPNGVSAVAATLDGRWVVSAGWDGWVRVWDAFTGEGLVEFQAHSEATGALALTPDSLRIVTGSDDHLIRIWDLASGKKLGELVGHGDPVRALAISPDGSTLVSGSWDHTVRAWELETGAQIAFFAGHQAWVRAVTFTSDGRYILSGGWDRIVRVWDLASGELNSAIKDIPAAIFSLALTPAADRLIVGTGDGLIKLYSFPGGAEIGELRGHKGGVNQVLVTREGRFAISAADDCTLRTWDLAAIQSKCSQPGHDAPVYALQMIPNTNWCVSASWDGTLKVWELATGKAVATLAGHSGGITALAVAANGRRAASGARDHMLKVWDLEALAEERSLVGHSGAITALAISSDGRWAVSGADDGVLIVWDLDSGQRVADFRAESAIWTCSVSTDGRTIVAAESGGKMYFLEVKR